MQKLHQELKVFLLTICDLMGSIMSIRHSVIKPVTTVPLCCVHLVVVLLNCLDTRMHCLLGQMVTIFYFRSTWALFYYVLYLVSSCSFEKRWLDLCEHTYACMLRAHRANREEVAILRSTECNLFEAHCLIRWVIGVHTGLILFLHLCAHMCISQEPCTKGKRSRSCSPPLRWSAAWPSDRNGSPSAHPAGTPPEEGR